jgi:Carboxypeptidase regulatory-like domain
VLQRNGLAWLILGLAPSIAGAHSPSAAYKQVGERVFIEAFFSDNTPIQDAHVQVLDQTKKVVASGKTDAKGNCSLPAPNPGKYRLVVDAGAGHRHEQEMVMVGTLPTPEVEAPATKQDDVEPPPVSPARAELTRFPWDRVAIGCGVIALLGGVWWFTRVNARRNGKSS